MKYLYIKCNPWTKNFDLDLDIWEQFLPAEAMRIHCDYINSDAKIETVAIYQALEFNQDFCYAPFKPHKINELTTIILMEHEKIDILNNYTMKKLPVTAALKEYSILCGKSSEELLEEKIATMPESLKTYLSKEIRCKLNSKSFAPIYVGIKLYARSQLIKMRACQPLVDYTFPSLKISKSSTIKGRLSLVHPGAEGALSETNTNNELSLIQQKDERFTPLISGRSSKQKTALNS